MNVKVIDGSFQALYGKPCWGLHYDRQLNLSMSFGKPSLTVREPYGTDSKSKVVQQGGELPFVANGGFGFTVATGD
jgi:hypothetical protein